MTNEQREAAIAILAKEEELQRSRFTHCRIPRSSRAYKSMEALQVAIDAMTLQPKLVAAIKAALEFAQAMNYTEAKLDIETQIEDVLKLCEVEGA